MKSFGPKKDFNCMHGLKSAILAIFQKLADWPDYHQKLRLVFCHSDPDASSVFWQKLLPNANSTGKLKKLKLWEPFVIYLLNSAANQAQFERIWAGLAVLFHRQSQIVNSSYDFYCFNFPVLRPFIK